MYLRYYYGKEDEEELFELKCTRQMMFDCLIEEFDTDGQREVFEIMFTELDDDVLYDCFYDLFLDYYQDIADQLYRSASNE